MPGVSLRQVRKEWGGSMGPLMLLLAREARLYVQIGTAWARHDHEYKRPPAADGAHLTLAPTPDRKYKCQQCCTRRSWPQLTTANLQRDSR